eukprot:350660-Chlamydomonas_euryale.AAC.1
MHNPKPCKLNPKPYLELLHNTRALVHLVEVPHRQPAALIAARHEAAAAARGREKLERAAAPRVQLVDSGLDLRSGLDNMLKDGSAAAACRLDMLLASDVLERGVNAACIRRVRSRTGFRSRASGIV